MIKKPDSGESWMILDTARNPANIVSARPLLANTTVAEEAASVRHWHFHSNGFKLRGTDGQVNGSTNNYIFCAFAEFPFGGSGVVQARADGDRT